MAKTCCESEESCNGSEDRRMEHCMICGTELFYLSKPIEVTCYYCGKEEIGYFKCPKNHYVCEHCHTRNTFEIVKQIVLSVESVNPLEIVEIVLRHPTIPLIGCEHAFITAGSIMAAIRNEGTLQLVEKDVIEAMTRAEKISISGYCGLAGTCGIASGLASAFSVVLGSNCSKDEEFRRVLFIQAEATQTIASTAGPCCCKRFIRDVLYVGMKVVDELFNIDLGEHPDNLCCTFSEKHPHCKKIKCHFY